MTSKSTSFASWLCEYLNSIGLDGDVYGGYIASSLQDLKESTEEERLEAIKEFVTGALVRPTIDVGVWLILVHVWAIPTVS